MAGKTAGKKKGGARAKANGSGKAKANGGGKQARRKKDDDASPGIGHNLSKISSQAKQFATRYNNLLDEKEKLSGEIMSDVKNLLEEGANAIGCPRKILRMALQDQRREMKRLETEKELEPEERDTLETLRDALGILGELPLGQAAMKAAGEDGDQAEEGEPDGEGEGGQASEAQMAQHRVGVPEPA
jgi:hypothetical protein